MIDICPPRAYNIPIRFNLEETHMQREKLASRLGFILLSAGCAIGCGNVWKFPWMAGQYGGGGFVLIYVLCLILLGLPVMTMEFSLGRAAQASPVKMYQKLQKPGQKWPTHGYLALCGNISLMIKASDLKFGNWKKVKAYMHSL